MAIQFAQQPKTPLERLAPTIIYLRGENNKEQIAILPDRLFAATKYLRRPPPQRDHTVIRSCRASCINRPDNRPATRRWIDTNLRRRIELCAASVAAVHAINLRVAIAVVVP